MEATEKIVCAAIKYQNNVFIGVRHPTILAQVWETLGGDYPKGSERGFMTSQNRFVNRKEAARLAFEAGQTGCLYEELYSEDFRLCT